MGVMTGTGGLESSKCNSIISVGIFVMKKRIRVFFLLKAKTHLILLDDTINMKKN